MSNYLESCQSEFWRKVFEQELNYLLTFLKGYKDVLSVGCGPAIIERELKEHGFRVTGLDVSKEALNGAPDSIRTVIGSAEHMDFPDSSFDAAIYVASLQFIVNYKRAIRETARVLRPNSGIVVMLLNPGSEHFKRGSRDPNSYMCKIKHTDLPRIEETIAQYFSVQTEYYLGITEERIFLSQDPRLASLYIIQGTKK